MPTPHAGKFALFDDSHCWRTVARHRTDHGRVRHQACPCGAWRIVHGLKETWRSSTDACSEVSAMEPTPRGWPYRKSWGATGIFRTSSD
jgi:hypothetical protein